ncbi:putative hydroxypyruvate isomerase [Drosophila tropicalis]|uniref:putative hydroxypyruvate isomerase n=1 Tax=Drosophila tropicalis TaxID=46794 RepID=UPI0035AB9D1B
MSLKFAANLNFLFTETATTIAERIRLAHKQGFPAVEIPYPEGETQNVIDAIQATGITVSLVNLSFDKTNEKLRFGSTSIPGSEELFKKQLNETIEFAKQAKCKKVHITAGIISDRSESDHAQTYLANLKVAAASLKANNLQGVIEPINKYAIPTYFMNSYPKALQVLNELGYDNVKILADLYHLQHIHGNVAYTLKEYKNSIGHFQIAQVPHRHEPDVAGELDYGYIFKQVEEFGYDGWIGCEYKPKTTTSEGLGWVSKFGYQL